MIEKILLADSGSGQTEKMLNALLDLPSIQRATVTVLHVVPRKTAKDEMEAKREEGAKTLAQAVEGLHQDPSKVVAVNTLLREGDPKDEVCKAADEIDADLIIMGSRGLKRLQSILSNSVSQYVFQLSSKPMLLVRDDLYVKRLNRVMVALNSSPVAQESLDLALRLLQDNKSGKLILANVRSNANERTEMTAAEVERDPLFGPAIAKAKQRGVTYQCVVMVGNPGSTICQIAETTNADLLILGSPDRRPSVARSLPDLDRLLGSSISDYVRVQAPCPVLFIRKAE
jgi:nucleotide-binding universal stress UspA family protein